MSMIVLLVLCVCVLGIDTGSPVWFTVKTQRSAAGQWQAEVDIEHGGNTREVVLTHYTENCEGADKTINSKTIVTADEDPDYNGEIRSCEKTCLTPRSEGVIFTCESSSCRRGFQPAGTKMYMKCKEGYINKSNTTTSTYIFCTDSGVWSGSVLDCIQVPTGYTFFPELGWYQLYNIGNTYDQAKRICEFDGAHLGIIDSPGELEAFQQLINTTQPPIRVQHKHDIYVGVKRYAENEGYVDLKGRPMTASYHFTWCNGRPPPTGQFGDCTIYAKQLTCHFDSACNRKLPFFCEIPIKL